MLERIPQDKLDWQPHPKSHTIGWNANHLASLPEWLVHTMGQSAARISLRWVAPPYVSPKLASRRKIVEMFDRNVAAARAALKAATDEDMAGIWTLLQGGNPIFSMPRSAVVRAVVLNHMIHHRAHLCVYLRLNDIPVPGMYGPSGDE